MISFLPANISKLSALVPIIYGYILSEIMENEFIINVDDSNNKNYNNNVFEELKYWGMSNFSIAYLSSIESSFIEDFLLRMDPGLITAREVDIISCECGKLELYGRDLEEKIYGDMKVLENGNCKFCQTSHLVRSKQLFLLMSLPQVQIQVYPPNMDKFFKNKLRNEYSKNIRISRIRKTPFTIKFENTQYSIDTDFVSNLTLLYLSDKNKDDYILFSQRRAEKLLLLSHVVREKTHFIGLPYLQNFFNYYDTVKSGSNNFKNLVIFLALCTSWRSNYNSCNEIILKSYNKLDSTTIGDLYNLILSQNNVYDFLKIFNNNLLSYIRH